MKAKRQIRCEPNTAGDYVRIEAVLHERTVKISLSYHKRRQTFKILAGDLCLDSKGVGHGGFQTQLNDGPDANGWGQSGDHCSELRCGCRRHGARLRIDLGAPRAISEELRPWPYLGLIPKQEDSGDGPPQLGISKAGDRMLLRLLVGSAHNRDAPRSFENVWPT
jgi:hypothetical protein